MRKRVLCLLVASLLIPASSAFAANITFFVSNAYTTVVADVVPGFEARTGHKVDVQNGTSASLSKRILGGDAFDLIVLTPTEDLQPIADAGFIVPSSIRGLAKGYLGMGVKAGAPHPKIDTVDQFKEALLNAHKISYTDPASGGLSGVYMAELFKRLNIEDKLIKKDSLLPLRPLDAPESLLSGKADLSLQQVAVLMVPGIEIVGPLPGELQYYFTRSGAISSKSKNPEAAKLLLEALSSKETKALLPSKGMMPID